jgi:adenylate kinase
MVPVAKTKIEAKRLTRPLAPATGAVAVVLLGSPGSGKGTEARLLSDAFAIPHISTGDMLRAYVRQGHPNDAAVEGKLKAGILVKDEVVNALVEERLNQPDAARGFILDGYPRTLAQAETLGSLLASRGAQELVIHLVVDYNVIIARLTGRRQCPVCGTVYNLVSRPPKVPGVCDRDGAKLIVRDDDRESVIRERLDSYEHQTRPLLDYYRGKGKRVFEIEASHDIPHAIFRKIEALIRES